MKKLAVRISSALRGKEGQGMVEYGLIIALVSIVVIAALILVGKQLTGTFSNIASSLTSSTAAVSN
ncbi:MAG: Flp family type IVb pilin [Clostridia bacterium]|nr:Flp family type IVb pilin [Clostridia bacterium]